MTTFTFIELHFPVVSDAPQWEYRTIAYRGDAFPRPIGNMSRAMRHLENLRKVRGFQICGVSQIEAPSLKAAKAVIFGEEYDARDRALDEQGYSF